MSADMNPKTVSMTAQIDSEKREEKKETELKGSPGTLEEFLLHENLKTWPVPVPLESHAIASRALLLGNQNDIETLLRDAAPLPIDMLDKLGKRLRELEDVLNKYAYMIITDEDRDQSPTRAFLTETGESQGRSVLSAMSRKSIGSNQDNAERFLQSKKKTVENCVFPGFRHGELVELPAQLEAPPILHRVTKVQDFNSGFKKFWKKIFLSEASVAVMQDGFWWIFLKNFQKKKVKEQDQLFDRIADSFVALFHSINADVKDKFLMTYPNCLAQSLFVAFYKSFPDSRERFDADDFKQNLVDLVYEWTSGIKVIPGLWKQWDMPHLLGGSMMGGEAAAAAAKQMLGPQPNLNRRKSTHCSVDIHMFEKFISKLGEPSHGETNPPSSEGRALMGGLMLRSHEATSLLSELDEESHPIGPGADLERVKFNLDGRSPLVAHYLDRRKLQNYEQPGKKVRRTEITALPQPGPTYKELITNTLSLSDNLNREYQKICEHTDRQIMELEKQKRETNREIDKLQRELLFTKNSVELKILSEKIMEIKDRDRHRSFFSTEGNDDLSGSEEEF
ncbi:protein FAM227B-like [Liolophura sinensis]|uniref:protein FAM227B-like n=1 Tax=Liolophura sinensis TaxID=3198878 RepID=UPI003158541B